MQNNIIKINTIAIVIITIGGMLTSCLHNYFAGQPSVFIFTNTIYWLQYFALALLVNRLCKIFLQDSKRLILYILPFLTFITPVVYLIASFSRFDGDSYKIYYSLMAIISTGSIVFIALLLFKEIGEYITRESGFSKKKQFAEQQTSVAINIEKDLGNGRTLLDRVINSVLQRANSSSRITSFSLVTMVVIVIIGGSASFGTLALNEASKIREIEVERQKVVELSNVLSITDSTKYSEIKDLIRASFGEENSYKKLMEKIDKQSYISWPDIAMRIAIAALTIFLVQILFHIYKYNQQQASQLLNKAEMIELYKEENANHDDLRTGLLSKVDAIPRFENDPSTPTDRVLNIGSKSKET
jgi:hypothetical protein